MSPGPSASLHLDAGRTLRGGQRQVLFLLAGLQRRGHRVLLCCPQASPLHTRAREAGIPVRPLALRSGLDFASAMRLARWVRTGDFDLVHAHDAHSHSVARAAQSITGHPALQHNLFVTRRSVGAEPGRLDRLKYDHASTHYLAISRPVRAALVRLGVDAARIAVVPSGVEVQRLADVGRLAEDPWGLCRRGARIVGSIGALTREKNPGLLLDALARLHRAVPDVHLLFVGDGPLRAALVRRAAQLDLTAQVTFAGHVDDTAPVYGVLSAFALASTAEGLGTALLDAMAAGVPVVTTAAAGVLDVARHGESALVVQPGDAEAMAGALQRLLEQPDLAARLVAGARQVVAAFNVDQMVAGTLAAYARFARAPLPEPT